MMIPATNVTTMTYHSVPELVSFDDGLSKSDKTTYSYGIHQHIAMCVGIQLTIIPQASVYELIADEVC